MPNVPSTGPTNAAPVVCPGCGCLCDDVTVELDASGRGVTVFRPECAVGRAWFEAAVAAGDDGPEAAVGGTQTTRETAVDRAAGLLRAARRPVVYGLTATTAESVREALALADRLRALVLPGPGVDPGRLDAFANVGRVGATLGEVKGRADVVVFWGCDPRATHPRHGERYSMEAVGRFVPDGRDGRTVVVIGDRPNSTAETSDVFVSLPGDRDLSLIAGLRWLGRDRLADAGRVAADCGLDVGVLESLLRVLQSARHGAVFFQPRNTEARGSRAAWEALSLLVRELNDARRFVVMGLGAAGNGPGAEAALAWQAGFPHGVDFGRGYPSPAEPHASLDAVLSAGEADALLVVAGALPAPLSPAARSRLEHIPVIIVAPDATRRGGPPAAVALRCATFGVDVSGSVTRPDGVTVPLRPLRVSGFPGDREWLSLIRQAAGEEADLAACAMPRTGRTSP